MKASSDYCDVHTECNTGTCFNHRCDAQVERGATDIFIDTIITVVAIIIVAIALILSCNRKRFIPVKEAKNKNDKIKRSKSEGHNTI